MTPTPVRIGVIGTTWYAETHIRNILSHPDAELVALVGRDGAKAREVADRHGIPSVFSDHHELIASGAIDAVVIIAPDALHAPIALEAFAAGLHVLCEKPLATSGAEAEEMYRAAVASGLVHMSFFALRTSVHHRYLKRLLDEDYVGRVYSARFELTHGFFRGPDYQWRFDAARGTGALGDLGCYIFDQARWYVGEIEAVSADLASVIDRPSVDGMTYTPENDSAVGLLRFAGGAHATFAANVVTHQAERMQANTILLAGENGTLELEHTFAGARLRGARADEKELRDIVVPDDAWAGVDPAAPNTAGQLHSVGDRAFIDAIVAGTGTTPDFLDGWRVQQAIDAAFASARSGGLSTSTTGEPS